MVADFDSLAAAVGVAKLWKLQDPSVSAFEYPLDRVHQSITLTYRRISRMAMANSLGCYLIYNKNRSPC